MRPLLTLILATLTAAPAGHIAYLQGGTPTAMSVMWQGGGPGAARLDVTDANGRQVWTGTQPPSFRHTLRATGLSPGTIYHYTAFEGGQEIARGHFRTNNGPQQRDFRFAVIGDSGSGNQNQRAVAAKLTAWRPDFILHVGDVVYEAGEAAAYTPRFLQPYRELVASSVLYPSLGNHDMRTEEGSPYLAFFDVPRDRPDSTERWYTFHYGDAQFFGLDTNSPFDRGSPQYNWLAAQLAASRDRWKFAFFHHPPYSGGDHGSSFYVRAAWGPLFERHDVNVVFTGHDHDYERTTPREDFVKDGTPTTYLVSGGGGAWLRAAKPQPFTAAQAVAYHFVGITMRGDHLAGDVIGRDGDVIDRFSITR